VGVTGGQKLNTPPVVRVRTPVIVAVPVIGVAMAGMDHAKNTPKAKALSLLKFSIIMLPPASWITI
jgi:hypothetical protein